MLTIDRLKETATYKNLAKNNDWVRIKLLEQKTIREKINHAYQVYKNTGAIPNTVTDICLAVVKDLIAEDIKDKSNE